MDNCPHCGGSLKDLQDDQCAFCGISFKRTRKWQKFCTPLCTSRFHYAERLRKQKEVGSEQQ